MRYFTSSLCAFVLSVVTVSPAVAQSQGSSRPGQQPARDTPAQQQTAPDPAGQISGHVISADSGRAVKRARVVVTAPELPQGRATVTEDDGGYQIAGLPAGRYTVRVSKAGFVNLAYGQRRPLMPGTPLQLGDGQQLKGVDFRLPRGGVIAGRLFDEDGEALPAATVRVMEYQYQQGQKQLVPVGNAQTDDRGDYRVWGLMPGTYYVVASARGEFGPGFGPGFGFGPGGQRGGPGGAGGPVGDDPNAVSYAPTYFPGVPTPADARAVSVGVSQEVQDINFGLQLVRTARITGRVTNPDGSAVTAGTLQVMPDGATAGRGPGGMNFGARIQWDGSFAVANVPPGRYVLRARSDDSTQPQYAIQPVTVAGDLTDLIVILAPAGTVTGTVAVEYTQQHAVPVDLTSIRVVVQPADQAPPGPTPNARADRDGKFTLSGVPAGQQLLRTNGLGREWTLKAVTLDGRDVTDTPIDVRPGQQVGKVRIVFTDRVSEVNGTVTDGAGTPATDLTVLAFTADASMWRPQARQIQTARPDQNGRFVIRGLPAGDYYLVAVDPTEQGEWYEPAFLDAHRAGASSFSLAEGATKSQDLRVSR